MILYINKYTRKNKKYDLLDGDKHKYILSYGDSRFPDFTIHKDDDRKQRYISRHGNEYWDKSGIYTAGFWAIHLLWGKPSLTESIRDVNKRFKINVKLIT